MNTDKATPELFTALSLAQGEIENADKNSTNPHFKSSYADLAEVLNTIRPVFSKNGLSLIQSPHFDGSFAHVTTILAHKSGGFIMDTASCVPSKTDGQGIGAATTYLRRYAAAAFAGIAQEDDDGESSKHEGAPAAPHKSSPPKTSNTRRPPSQGQRNEIVNPAIQGPKLLCGAYILDGEEFSSRPGTPNPWVAWRFTINHDGTVYSVCTFNKDLATKALTLANDKMEDKVDVDVEPGRKEGQIVMTGVLAGDDIPA